MSGMSDFNRDFVNRTLAILDNYDKEYEVTLLLNCLCGLVTLPIEIGKNNYTDKMDDFKEKCVKKLDSLCIRKNFYKRPYYNTFTDIRNSIAHFNIKIPKKEKIEEINLKAYIDKEKQGNKLVRPKLVFSITISVKNLKEFAKFVATEYLKIV
jgi:hypothetical protein